MEQIIQLKAMRDDALERLQNNPDFKLVNSLDALIQDLEAVMTPVSESVVEEPAQVDEGDTGTIEIAAESDETEASIGEEVALAGEEVPASADPDEGAIGEELAELASEQPDEAASAIEALEAELAQSDTVTEEVGVQPGSMIN